MCETINDDPAFDAAALQAIGQIGAPKYNVFAYPFTTPYLLGARNCQTWADEIIKRAAEIYKNGA